MTDIKEIVECLKTTNEIKMVVQETKEYDSVKEVVYVK